jgi:2-polyprenyl-3-methyl-5-hydroxy-6-metoxy-1,4-benzoquinol methylase
MKENRELQALYEQVYATGKERFFSRFTGSVDLSATDEVVLSAIDWNGKSVLDVGCGTGRTAALIAAAGAKRVVGLDFAPSAIELARSSFSAENLAFECGDFRDWTDPVDVIVSCGTIEHTDSPAETLSRMAALVPPGGHVVLTCPHFLNVRGFIWMALQTLLRVPMSLTDLHFLSPFDFERWSSSGEIPLTMVRHSTFDDGRANGEAMLVDLRKRLPNALRDAGYDTSGVPAFMEWLSRLVEYWNSHPPAPELDGAAALYVFTKPA